MDGIKEKVILATDTVGKTVETGIVSARQSISEANPFIGEKIDASEKFITTAKTEAEEAGFCTNYKNFNIELFRPFKRASEDKPLLEEILSTLKLAPENGKMAFVMWCVLGFWLGVVQFGLICLGSNEVVFYALLSLFKDVFLGYCFAYYYYFIFMCTDKKNWMLVGFVLVALNALWFGYQIYVSLSFDIGKAVFDFLKLCSSSIMGYHAFKLYQGAPPAKEMV